MRKKKQVCFRPDSAVANALGLSTTLPGSVICCYRVAREGAASQARLDVRFGRRIAWGVFEGEFETIPFSSRSRFMATKHAQRTNSREASVSV